MDLSVVVPCYNEARRLLPTVACLRAYLAERGGSSELVLVDDGSTDDTLVHMCALKHAWDSPQVVSLLTNQGKGRAVAEGVARTEGDLVLLTDADLSTPIDQMEKLEATLAAGADIAVGSRAAPGARELDQPLHRRLMGKAFNGIVQVLLLDGIRDTQCGFKLFRGPAARTLFGALRTDGFAFDVEILWKARLAGYRIEEVPVRWLNSHSSTVRPVRHSAQMAWDVLKIWHHAAALEDTAGAQTVKPAEPYS